MFAGANMVDDFSEIIAWNQSDREIISACCNADWRRRYFLTALE
jgi:hypothetical protein